MEQDCMARLMVCRNLLILFRNHLALLLRADAHLYKGPVNITLLDEPAVLPCRNNGCLIHQVF